MIDAHNSWWGDPSGPYDPSNGPPDFNPNGLGSKVSDYVIYRPWATAPNTNEPPSSFALLSPAPGDSVPRGNVHLLWSHSVALDGGPISYDLLVDDNPDFSSPVVNAPGLADTTYDLSNQLDYWTQYYWKVTAKDTHGGQRSSSPVSSWFVLRATSAVPGPAGGDGPLVFRVSAPAPNPFRGENALAYELPASGRVRLDIFDVGGRLVRTLLDGPVAAGRHVTGWDGNDRQGHAMRSGVYFYRLRSPAGNAVRRMVLMR